MRSDVNPPTTIPFGWSKSQFYRESLPDMRTGREALE